MIHFTSKEWVHSGLHRLVNTSESWLQEVLLNSLYSTEYFLQQFLSDSFDGPFTEQRRRHVAALDDDTLPYMDSCCYRGFGKTSLFIGKCVKNGCFRLEPFTVVVSKTLDYAQSITEIIKSQLLTNPNIRDVFGAMKPVAYHGDNPSFSAKTWHLSDPESGQPFAVYVPKGAGQQMNGLIDEIGGRIWRPTLLGFEDAEDREEVMNEDLREKTSEWFWGTAVPCVSDQRPNPNTNRWDRPKGASPFLWRPPWRVCYDDTLKHEAALMADLQQSPEWFSLTFPKCEVREDGQYYSCVPEIVSDDQIRKEVEDAQRRGKMDRFAMEYMCRPQADSADNWTRDLFRYYDDNETKALLEPDVERVCICDPARTATSRSSHTAALTGAFSGKLNRIWARNLLHARMGVEEIPFRIIKFALSQQTFVIAVEITGGDDLWKLAFIKAAQELGVADVVQFVWLDARTAPKGDYGTGKDAPKRARASLLLPYYKLGQVYHDESLRDSVLEKQMLSYPKAAHWDAIDCAAYIPVLIEMSGQTWSVNQDEARDVRHVVDRSDYQRTTRRIRSGEWRRCA